MTVLRDLTRFVFGVVGVVLMVVCAVAFTVWLWRLDADLAQIILIGMAGTLCAAIYEALE